MRKLIISLVLFFPVLIFAQSETSISDIKVPATPGVILLDQAPSAIERPSNPKDLAASLYSIYNGTAALEFAPYWLKSHPDLSFEAQAAKKFPFLSTLSVSGGRAEVNGVALYSAGLKATLFRSNRMETLDAAKLKLQLALADMPFGATKIPKSVEDAKKELNSVLNRAYFSIDISAAAIGYSANGQFKNLRNYRSGAWLTVSGTPFKSNDLSFIAVGRVIYKGDSLLAGIEKMNIDAGIALEGRLNDRCIIQLEIINRLENRSVTDSQLMIVKSGPVNYLRIAGIINYQVNDLIYLTGTIGKDYTPGSNILFSLGIQTGISSNSKLN